MMAENMITEKFYEEYRSKFGQNIQIGPKRMKMQPVKNAEILA